MLSEELAAVFNQIADIFALLSVIGLSVFVFMYSRFYQWRRRRVGRAFLFLALAFLAVNVISFLALWISPDYWLRPVFRTLGWGFAAVVVGYVLYALFRNWDKPEMIEIPTKGKKS